MGKTTSAAAAAVAAAERGRKVLCVSLDPAHSLGDAFARKLGPSPVRVPTRRGTLHAVELDADRALGRWFASRKSALGRIVERGTYLDSDDVDRLLALSFPGVDELHSLRALVALAERRKPDEVVVDTAPTGHTLRLLATPDALARIAGVLDRMHEKHRLLSLRLAGAYRSDASDDLVAEIETDAGRILALLRDGARTRFTWVTNAEPLAVEETVDGIRALGEMKIAVSDVVVNRTTTTPPQPCHACAARMRSERAALDRLRAALPGCRLAHVPAAAGEPRGVEQLRPLARAMEARARPPTAARPRGRAPSLPRAAGARALGTSLSAARLLLFGGKGGVGKTTCAATAALALAADSPRRRVLLLSVDPAHSLGDVLGVRIGDEERSIPGAPPRLRAREIDASTILASRRERYREAVGEMFDLLQRQSRLEAAYDRDVVEDLVEIAPPGLDEICAVLAVNDALFPEEGAPRYDVVVLDTAPTGHTLRLLAMPHAAHEWVKAILAILLEYRQAVGLPQFASDLVDLGRQLRELEALLGDARRCAFVTVARPTALARLETRRLVHALAKSRIRPAAMVVVGLRGSDATCARCRRSAREESREARAIAALAKNAPVWSAPLVAPPPRGVAHLGRWGSTWRPFADPRGVIS